MNQNRMQSMNETNMLEITKNPNPEEVKTLYEEKWEKLSSVKELELAKKVYWRSKKIRVIESTAFELCFTKQASSEGFLGKDLYVLSLFEKNSQECLPLSKAGYEGLLNRLSARSKGFHMYLNELERMEVLNFMLHRLERDEDPSFAFVLDGEVIGFVSRFYMKVDQYEVLDFILDQLKALIGEGYSFDELLYDERLMKSYFKIREEEANAKSYFNVGLSYKTSMNGFGSESLDIYISKDQVRFPYLHLLSLAHKGSDVSEYEEKLMSKINERMFDELQSLEEKLQWLSQARLSNPIKAFNYCISAIKPRKSVEEDLRFDFDFLLMQSSEIMAIELFDLFFSRLERETKDKNIDQLEAESKGFATIIRAFLNNSSKVGGLEGRSI